MSGIRFTAAEDEFLRSHIESHSYAEMAKMLTERFGIQRNLYAVSDRCTKQLKIKREKNSGQFKNGRKRRKKIGDEAEVNGYIYVKIADVYFEGASTPTGYGLPNWKPKQQVVWERSNGENVPDGRFVIFLDGDNNNFAADNLYCIDRKISARMASNGWFSGDATVTLTAIKYCELMDALKSKKEVRDDG